MPKAIYLVLILAVVWLTGCGRQPAKPDDSFNLNETDLSEMVNSYNDLLKDETPANNGKVKASCNVIPSASNCIDYTGSYWANTDYAKLNCEGTGDLAERKFSKDGCPYSTYGGCKTAAGTIMEMIAWVYPEGGGEYNAENIQYAAGACNAVVGSQWTTPEQELQRR